MWRTKQEMYSGMLKRRKGSGGESLGSIFSAHSQDTLRFLPLCFVLQQVHWARFRDAPNSVSTLRSHLLLKQRTSLRVRTWSTNVCNIKRQMTKNYAVLQSAAVTHFGGSWWLSVFSAGSPRRTKWIFALGRPSPRLSQLPLFVSVGARIQSFPKSLTTGAGNAAFSELGCWQLTKATQRSYYANSF